jgi:sugar lactone lactonase YvrE
MGLLVAMGVLANAATRTVTTVAGGFVGDGKPATAASLERPVGVARDTQGNIYISDYDECRIRKINATGVISTYAGTGICGYNGDGGPATSASISPYGIALDAKGDLLVAEFENSRIRQVSPAGIITTVAGSGTVGYSGDGGPAVRARLNQPTSVTVDASGKIYIADSGNFVIRVVDAGGIIHTVAGNHIAGFSGDGGRATSAEINYVNGIVVDNNGNFYFADSGNNRVRRVDSTRTIVTYAGNGFSGNLGSGGLATSASIGYTLGLLVAGGRLYISTGTNIWSVTLSNQIISIVGGNSSGTTGFSGDGSTALDTLFGLAWGMASDGTGGLIFADALNARVRRIAGSTRIVTTLGGGYLGDAKLATAASLNLGSHITFDTAGNLYIADTYNHRVRKVTPAGVMTTFAGTGKSSYSGDGGPANRASLDLPRAVAADRQGNVYIADYGNGVIRRVDNTGTIATFLTNFSSNFSNSASANALVTDSSGNLYASDGLWAIWKITPSASTTVVAGTPGSTGYNGDGIPATQAWLSVPSGLAIDSLGSLYISEYLNQRVRKVDPSGTISTVAGNGTAGFSGDGGLATSAMVNFPEDVGVDATGNLYIADFGNYRIRRVNLSGVITTLAGSNGFGYNGDGLPPLKTNVFPTGVVVGPGGTVYFADPGSYRVRKIH